MAGKRDFGRVRQLASGRWQVRYLGPDGVVRPAPTTFARKRDATDWLADKQAEIGRGDWLDPDAGKVPFGEYAARWLAERDLSESTRERYEICLRLHLVPTFGKTAIADVREPAIRQWRKERQDSGVGAATVAKTYRLAHAIFHTAEDDGLIRRNPCRIKGASQDRSPERQVLSIAQVLAVADAIPARFRALVLLATFTSLRFGELAALRRCDVDLVAGDVHVRRSQSELRGRTIVKDPKSEAGRRSVSIPPSVVPELAEHLDEFAEPGQYGLMFVGGRGGRLLRRNFQRTWRTALDDAGLAGRDVHFHDLRHTGNHLAAMTGASTKELMARMGHSSMRAALIYQHATRERDQVIATGVDAAVRSALIGHATAQAET